MLRENIDACYYKNKSVNNSLKYCPTKNIRWHHVDPRQGNKYNFEYKIYHLGKLLDTFTIFSNRTQFDEYSATFNNKIETTCKDIFENNKNEMIQYLNIIKLMMNPYENFWDTIFSGDFNSLIVKQVVKIVAQINFKGGNDKLEGKIGFWKYICNTFHEKILMNIINDFFKDFNYNRIILKNTVILIDLIINILNGSGANILQYKQFITSVKIFLFTRWTQLISPLLDLYYCFRMIKKPRDANNAFLSIGYFGNTHTININILLSEILVFYNTEYSHFNNINAIDKRCISFNKNIININQIASKFNVDILSNTITNAISNNSKSNISKSNNSRSNNSRSNNSRSNNSRSSTNARSNNNISRSSTNARSNNNISRSNNSSKSNTSKYNLKSNNKSKKSNHKLKSTRGKKIGKKKIVTKFSLKRNLLAKA